ncbi:hypothetical protein ACRAR1_07640 [Streptomyces sanyensis]|uniref:hypothetical protein n=1 Tax=Streptomyces sanyensis TaxID=568869 RepID=UPI003D78642F
MPGSTTLGPGHGVDSVEHEDARRLAHLARRLHALLESEGPERLSDAQAAALGGDDHSSREELTAWTERVAGVLRTATGG